VAVKRRVVIGVTAAVVAVVALLFALSGSRRGPAAGAPGASQAPRSTPEGARDRAPSPALAGGSSSEVGFPAGADPQQLIAHLQGRFGGRLGNPYVQIKLLEDLIRHFRKVSPDRWEQAVLEVLRAAFPEKYEELAANLRRWVEYERWMNAHQADLQRLGDEDRRANLWETRNRIFGEEAAAQIWASEVKNRAVAKSLADLDARAGVSVSEKLSLYKESLEEIYGERAEAYLQRHQHEAMMRFIELGSVQKELSAMTPGQRAKNLREIRTGMGLEEEALQRWDVLDRERDARWSVGARYMAEREALSKQYSGAELEARLKPVRERYFGAEAETIGHEEESGFFRFGQPRVWGRN
jgi:hypothetical protein